MKLGSRNSNWVFFKQKAFYVFSCLFAFSLCFDAHWSSKMLILVGIFGLPQVRNHHFTKIKRPLLLLLLLLVFCSIQMFFYVGRIDFEWIALFVMMSLLLTVFVANPFSKRNLNIILLSFCSGVLVVGTLHFFAFVISDTKIHDFEGFIGLWEQNRLVDIHKLYYGIYLNFALLTILYFWKQRLFSILLLVLLCIPLVILLLFTGSLGAIIIGPILVVLMLGERYLPWNPKIKALTVMLIPILFFLSMINPKIKLAFEKMDGDKSRVRNITTNQRIVKDAILLGHGIGREQETMQKYRLVSSWEYTQNYNAHNQYFEFLIGGGIIWLLLFLLLLILFTFNRNVDFLGLGFISIILFTFLFESVLNRHHGVFFFSFFYTLIFSKYLALNERNHKKFTN